MVCVIKDNILTLVFFDYRDILSPFPFIYLKFLAIPCVQHVGSWFLHQESNLCTLHWQHRVLTTATPVLTTGLTFFFK